MLGRGCIERRIEGTEEADREGQRRTEADKGGQRRTEADKGDIAKCTN